MFVAVVANSDERSERPDGSLACWIGKNKDDVVRRALLWRDTWEREAGRWAAENGPPVKCRGPYRVLIGELTEQAFVPVQYIAVTAEE